MEQAAFNQRNLAALLRAESVNTSTNSSLPHPRSQISEADYLSSRLDDQIAWYSTKSTYCQTRHKVLRVLEVVAAAFIPFLSAIGTEIPYSSWIVGGLGAIIAVCAASSGIFKFHENWIQYRATSEQLKHEKYLFLARAAPYADGDAFHVLVHRVEGLISKENSTWTQTIKSRQGSGDAA